MTSVPALDGYRPRTATEAADLDRLRDLLSSDEPWSRATALHLTGSALIVHPPTGRVLLRWHPRQRRWLHVGGHGDPGEHDPLTVALREGTEETGLADLYPLNVKGLELSTVDVEPIHVIIVPVNPSATEPAHEHADVCYLLATDRPDEIRPERPDAPLRWLSLAQARELVGPDNLSETLDRVGREIDR